jgi:branched-chain amino acid transport system ATP-binding protein
MLAAHDLHVYYGASHILHGVSVTMAPGEAVSLIGRNGMGKTTLLRAIVAWRRRAGARSPSPAPT